MQNSSAMGGGIHSQEDDEFSWTEDDLEEENFALPSCTSAGNGISDLRKEDDFKWTDDELETENTTTRSTHFRVVPEADMPGPSQSTIFLDFIGMGFSKEMVAKAIEENGEGNTEAILETLLTYSALKEPPQGCGQFPVHTNSIEREKDSLDDELSDVDIGVLSEDTLPTLTEKEKKLLFLVEMGFSKVEATAAFDRCGPNASLMELQDLIYAAKAASEFDDHLEELSLSGSDEAKPGPSHFNDESPRDKKRRKHPQEERQWGNKIPSQSMKKKWEDISNPKSWQNELVDEDDEHFSTILPNHMIGFGVPDEPNLLTHRNIPGAAIGPPFFYYENVALAPKGVWEDMSRLLYDIKPEFVDSMHFCAAARKRGYIHNLPLHNRYPLEPRPPRTIHEAFPLTRKWWPSWDQRTHLNCLQTVIASAKTTEKIRVALSSNSDPPPPDVQTYVLKDCRKWNLVWVGVNKVAPLEPDEMEMLLGFPKNHTRGGGISRTERFRSLGNTFQVDTVAYHLSVLKDMFRNGIRVLSLFSGIGGAEVALHRIGIPIKALVSVEISEINRNIFQSWWEQTNQTGIFIHLCDVQQLNGDRLKELMDKVGGFDLVVGGSPCNNITGSNRVHRDGLEGKHSSLFYDYIRILDLVKNIMEKRRSC